MNNEVPDNFRDYIIKQVRIMRRTKNKRIKQKVAKRINAIMVFIREEIIKEQESKEIKLWDFLVTPVEVDFKETKNESINTRRY